MHVCVWYRTVASSFRAQVVVNFKLSYPAALNVRSVAVMAGNARRAWQPAQQHQDATRGSPSKRWRNANFPVLDHPCVQVKQIADVLICVTRCCEEFFHCWGFRESKWLQSQACPMTHGASSGLRVCVRSLWQKDVLPTFCLVWMARLSYQCVSSSGKRKLRRCVK